MTKKFKKICMWCGKEYEGTKDSKFCSKACLGQSLSKKQTINCLNCGKEVVVRNGRQFCSKECADKYKSGKRKVAMILKRCEFCGNTFEVPNTIYGNKKRFCNTSCSAKWRMSTFGKVQVSEQGIQNRRNALKKSWENPEFRQNNYIRMTTNNPVYQDGVVEKAKLTRLQNGSYTNNYKYGNGKMSPQEQKAKNYLDKYGFYYNYAIATKSARDAFPQENYAVNYKPDFVNLQKFICIEIDGNNHFKKGYKENYDDKKERCLKFLGYKIYRFTNEQVDNGEFYKEVDKICQNW